MRTRSFGCADTHSYISISLREDIGRNSNKEVGSQNDSFFLFLCFSIFSLPATTPFHLPLVALLSTTRRVSIGPLSYAANRYE